MKHFIFISGLSGTGKTTLSKQLYKNLSKDYNNVILLDGDILRGSLKILKINNQHSYSRKERLKYAMYYVKLSKLLYNQNKIIILSTISLFREIHNFNKKNFPNYTEVYLQTDINILKNRKKIYKFKRNVVGRDIKYDIPKTPSIIFNNLKKNEIKKAVDDIVNFIK